MLLELLFRLILSFGTLSNNTWVTSKAFEFDVSFDHFCQDLIADTLDTCNF